MTFFVMRGLHGALEASTLGRDSLQAQPFWELVSKRDFICSLLRNAFLICIMV